MSPVSADMIVQFTPWRALFSAIFFVNCMTLLFLLNRSNNLFGESLGNNFSNITTSNLSSYENIKDHKPDLECAAVDQLNRDGIVVVLKTGAQEISSLAIHFSTTLRCFEPEDILLFSDLDQTVGQFHIHDALRNVNETIKNNHPDFEIYRMIQHYNATGQDLNILKEDHRNGDDRAGWKLDKYKFLHMAEETYEMRPGANWYAFLETDTYMIWPNLIKWLERWDSSKPLYMGSPTQLGGQVFAHGGSGYVISRAAMENLFRENENHELSAIWDERIQNTCCGDYGIGKALFDTGTKLTDSWPMCNGEPPATIPFGREHWCQPVITLHHATPDDISDIWRFQRHREGDQGNLDPILYRDVHDSFLVPQFPGTMDNWDNISNGQSFKPPPPEVDSYSTADSNFASDVSPSTSETQTETQPDLDLKSKTETNKRTETSSKLAAYKSFENCAKACQVEPSCFQYSFHEESGRKGMGECRFGNGETWTWGKWREGSRSGWNIDKIRDWVGKEENSCETVGWVDK